MNCLKVSCLGGSLESIDCLFLGKINVISSSDLSVVFSGPAFERNFIFCHCSSGSCRA